MNHPSPHYLRRSPLVLTLTLVLTLLGAGSLRFAPTLQAAPPSSPASRAVAAPAVALNMANVQQMSTVFLSPTRRCPASHPNV